MTSETDLCFIQVVSVPVTGPAAYRTGHVGWLGDQDVIWMSSAPPTGQVKMRRLGEYRTAQSGLYGL